jgi:hypothetical protein
LPNLQRAIFGQVPKIIAGGKQQKIVINAELSQ